MAVSSKTAEALAVLTKVALREKNPEKLAVLKSDLEEWTWQAATEDPWFFLRKVALTRNENPDGETPYEPFPDKEYLKSLLRQWNRVLAKKSNRLSITLKSRQMMASWFYCAMFLWVCMTQRGKRCGWQGKKAEDTNEMLERIYGIWERLPESIRKKIPCEKRFMHLRFPLTGCDIHAIPQGPDQVRQYTWSYFVIDEMAFQDDSEAGYYALLPALGKHGAAFMVSTASPSFFETIYSQHRVDSHTKEMQGVELWSNHNEIEAMFLHWSADPSKSEEWADAEAAKYGGRDSAFWRSEYEGDFGAMRGGLVFPQFSMDRHVIKSAVFKKVPNEWPKYRSIDPGYGESACAVGWYAVNPADRMMILYRELYVRNQTVQEIAPKIKAMSGREEYEFTIIDPSAFAQTLAASGKSIADLFCAHGINVTPAYRDATKKHQIQAFADALVVRAWGEPSFKALDTCENFVNEMLRYRWREVPDGSPKPETPIKVDDHMIDACIPGWVTVECRDGRRRIDSISVGDEVLTRDGWRSVKAHAVTNEDAELWMVLHEDGKLIATANHPVWTENRGFVRLDQLTQSDTLLGGPDPRQVAVISLPENARMRDRVYNIEVDGKPEYFADGILVHNCMYVIQSVDPRMARSRQGGGEDGNEWYEGNEFVRNRGSYKSRPRAISSEYEP